MKYQFNLRQLLLAVVFLSLLLGNELYRQQTYGNSDSLANWALTWTSWGTLAALLLCFALPVKLPRPGRQPNQVIMGALLVAPNLMMLICLFGWKPLIRWLGLPHWAGDLGLVSLPGYAFVACYELSCVYLSRVFGVPTPEEKEPA